MAAITNFLSRFDVTSLVTILDIQIALALVIIALLIKGVIARIIIGIVYKITKNTKKARESEMYSPIKKMIVFLAIYVALYIIPKGERTAYIITEVFKVIIIIFITKLITTLVHSDSKFLKKFLKKSEDYKVNDFVCKIIRGLIWLVSCFVIINELGFAYKITGLLTGLGFASAIIALAAQELVKNLLSGASILTDKPFELGDWIEVENYEGTVEDITFRSTRIKALNNTVITIPNSVITSEYVINWNRLRSRRLEITLPLHLDTKSDEIKKIVKQIKVVLASNPNVIADTIQVNFAGISDSSADIYMFMYVNKQQYVDFLNVKEEVFCSLLALIEKDNIELAYPTQTVYLKNNSEGEIK